MTQSEMISRAARHHRLMLEHRESAARKPYIMGGYDRDEAHYHFGQRCYWLAQSGVPGVRAFVDSEAQIAAFFAGLEAA